MKILLFIFSAFVCGCSLFPEMTDRKNRLDGLSFETNGEVWVHLRCFGESIWRADSFCVQEANYSILHKYMVLESTDKRLAPGDILYSLIPVEGELSIKNIYRRATGRKQETLARILTGTAIKWISTEHLNSLIPNNLEGTDGLKRNAWFIYWGVYPEISQESEKLLGEIYNDVQR